MVVGVRCAQLVLQAHHGATHVLFSLFREYELIYSFLLLGWKAWQGIWQGDPLALSLLTLLTLWPHLQPSPLLSGPLTFSGVSPGIPAFTYQSKHITECIGEDYRISLHIMWSMYIMGRTISQIRMQDEYNWNHKWQYYLYYLYDIW